MSSHNPIIIVTGANGGVGFGICQRLLIQLCQKTPPDALPQFKSLATEVKDSDLELSRCDGLALIMACRSIKRAEAAKQKLYRQLDKHIRKLKRQPGYDGHAEVFRSNLTIDVLYVDFAIIQSVFHFVERVVEDYPYVSHLIANAGVATFSGLDFSIALKQIFKEPVLAVTAPEFYVQSGGEVSADGLGWVWQCNVFGHYVMYRALKSALLRSTSPLGARMLWTTSLEASPRYYSPEDFQGIKTLHAYESSKYQMDLLATALDEQSVSSPPGEKVIRHILIQPGVASTNISNGLIGWFLDILKLWAFYLARWHSSNHHSISPYKAAIPAVHLALASFSFLPAFIYSASSMHPGGTTNIDNEKLPTKPKHTRPTSSPDEMTPSTRDLLAHPVPVRFGAETDWCGRERVGLTAVAEYDANKDEGRRLIKECDALYEKFWETEGKREKQDKSTTATDWM